MTQGTDAGAGDVGAARGGQGAPLRPEPVPRLARGFHVLVGVSAAKREREGDAWWSESPAGRGRVGPRGRRGSARSSAVGLARPPAVAGPRCIASLSTLVRFCLLFVSLSVSLSVSWSLCFRPSLPWFCTFLSLLYEFPWVCAFACVFSLGLSVLPLSGVSLCMLCVSLQPSLKFRPSPGIGVVGIVS